MGFGALIAENSSRGMNWIVKIFMTYSNMATYFTIVPIAEKVFG